uniref:Transcription repressor n=1 Tax=Oryza punctata TaxID=4537 RepID=A0A0E0L688_ORYPU
MDKSKARRHGVGGRLRQRLSQILLHSSCTTTSATAFVSLAKTNVAVAGNAAGARQAPPPAADAHQPRPKIDGSVRRRRRRSARALVHISIDCSGATSARHSARSVGAAVMPSPVASAKDVKAVIRSKARSGKPRSPSYSCSSSTVTDDELPPFSSSDGDGGEGAETRSSTLFSSLSISSDSTSDFYNSTGGSKRHHKNPPRRVPRRAPPRGANAADEVAASKPHEDKKDGAKKADDKHGGGGVVGVAAAGSMAVVKRSHNPYADFRSSMVEMVVERRICGADAMADLLVSYLSLNSRRHHPAILAAFEDVWEAVFGTP